MRKIWLDGVWEEYVIWQNKDKNAFKKNNTLIRSIDRNGYQCEGKPEALSGNLTGWWSIRFTKKDRIVFGIINDSIKFLQIDNHYNDK